MRGPKLAVLLALAAVGVGFQNYVFFAGGPPPVRAVEELDQEEDGEPSAASARSATVDELDTRAVTAWLAAREGPERSPFLTEAEALLGRGVPATAGSGSLHLTGTLFSTGRRVAWINGRPRSEGEWIGESQLVQIELRSVVLLRDGSRIPLHLDPGPVAAFPALRVTHAN